MEIDKVEIIEKLVIRLKNIARSSIAKQKYNIALSALSACSHILYEYNQRYKDDEIEEMLLMIGHSIISIPNSFSSQKERTVKTVLYYDGFGLDLRGLAAVQTKTIAQLGYKLVYVTVKRAQNRQHGLKKVLDDYGVEFVYIDDTHSYVRWIHELHQIMIQYEPQVAFLYTTPFDVAGVTVFNAYEKRVKRLFVNLTDHAFWIGVNSFDKCSASRAMGAWINIHGRGIPIEKMYRNRTGVFINEKAELTPLPFDTSKYRYVFSGGALYKTLGDPEKNFYRIIEYIVSHYSDVNFVYAGDGDESEFNHLIEKYPERIYLFSEREDFYQLIQNSVFFLNTYPMFGGQMMRYAACANKLPITLRHDQDGEGILFNQKELGIEFDSYEEIIAEIDHILCDDDYRLQKEIGLNDAVVKPSDYQKSFQMIIESDVSPFPILVEDFDNSKFRQEYLARLNVKKIKKNSIAKRINRCLFKYFPDAFIIHAVEMLGKKMNLKG